MSLRGAAAFVGRTDELRRLSAVVGSAASGSGGGVLVVGDPGSGKSRLIDEALARLEGERISVRRGAARGFEIERAFGPLLDALRVDASDWGPSGARALMEAGAGTTASVLAADRVLEEIEAACLAGPTVLVIEDLHWADGGTLRVLHTVLVHAAATGLAVLLTSRGAPTGTDLHRFVTSIEDHVDRIDLGPLSPVDSLDLAARLVGRSLGPRLTEVIRATDGSPLLVHALVEALDEQLIVHDGEAEIGSDASLRPRGVIASRIAELDSDCLAAVQAGAVLGESFPVDRLAAFTGSRALDLVPVLDRAERAGVLVPLQSTYGFRHELYRQAVLDTVASPARSAMHREAAHTLIALGAPPLDVAEHFALGAHDGDLVAIEWLTAVASRMTRRSPGTALRLADIAQSLTSEPSIELQTARVRALAGTGQAAAADSLGRSLLRGALPDPVQAELHRELALASVVLGKPADAVAHVATVAALTTDPITHARLLAEIAFGRYLARDRQGAWEAARDAASAGERLGDLTSQAAAHSILCFLHLLPNQIDDALRHARAAVELADHPGSVDAHPYQPWFMAGVVFLETDEVDDLTRAIRRGHEVAHRTGSAWAIPAYDALAAFGALRRGDLADATTFASAAFGSNEAVDAFGLAVWCHAFVAEVALLRGDDATARARAAVARDLIADDRSQLGWDHVVMVEATLAERAGDFDGANEALGEVWEVFTAFDILVARQWFGPRLVRGALRCGDRPHAERVAQGLLEGADQTGLLSFRVDAERAAAMVDEDADRALKAVELARMTPRRPQLAEALAEAATLLADAGRQNEADDAALEASRLFAAMGADDAAQRAAAVVSKEGAKGTKRVVARPRFGWDAVTASERQVMELVADGLSNVEIASRLYLSRRTVESHVSSAYRKLGLSTRVELTLAVLDRRR